MLSLLAGLKQVMRNEGLWGEHAPSQHDLSSQEPFCVDTLSFEQWLQFVMIVRFEQMIESNTALPTQCDIAPMAQEAFKHRSLNSIIEKINKIDDLLNKKY